MLRIRKMDRCSTVHLVVSASLFLFLCLTVSAASAAFSLVSLSAIPCSSSYFSLSVFLLPTSPLFLAIASRVHTHTHDGEQSGAFACVCSLTASSETSILVSQPQHRFPASLSFLLAACDPMKLPHTSLSLSLQHQRQRLDAERSCQRREKGCSLPTHICHSLVVARRLSSGDRGIR